MLQILAKGIQKTTSLVAAGKAVEDGRAGTLLGLALDDVEHVLPDLAGLLAGVDALPDADLLVVVDDGGGLLVVGAEALL